ncbi:hypothetical protein MASR2M48_25790 [Spirochaetota bacterium]
MLDALKKDYPAVVEDAQKNLSWVKFRRCYKGFFGNRFQYAPAILETPADYSGITKDPGFLVEKAAIPWPPDMSSVRRSRQGY